jgi:hypothetical protein
MGMTASFYLMPREAFERCRENPDGDHFPRGARAFDIDKAHYLFHLVFRGKPEPLNHALQGEVCPAGGLEAPGDDATHLGYVSPEAVQRIAHALESISLEDVFEEAEQLGWTRVEVSRRRYFELNWQSFIEAYRTAAQEGCALAVLMC